ncbi:hypothetical protein Trydic_g14286 [Trypoxylus dichotomus]
MPNGANRPDRKLANLDGVAVASEPNDRYYYYALPSCRAPTVVPTVTNRDVFINAKPGSLSLRLFSAIIVTVRWCVRPISAIEIADIKFSVCIDECRSYGGLMERGDVFTLGRDKFLCTSLR